MKIVLASNTSWSIYNFRISLVKKLREQGYDVHVVAPRDNYTKMLEPYVVFHDITIDRKGINPYRDISTFIRYLNIYKAINPDIVFSYTIKPVIYSSIAGKLSGAKTIGIITGAGYVFTRNNMLKQIVKLMYKISFKFTDEVWFLNEDDKHMFTEYGLLKGKYATILPGEGIDTERFKPVVDRNVVRQQDRFKFLLIARLLKDKGIYEYIEAGRLIKSKYNNVDLLILGDIDKGNPSTISMSNINIFEEEGIIKYLGTSHDVRKEIAEADCIVLPSYREGTSRVLLESASMGKPIITTDVPGCNNIVEDGVNGFLCKPKDSRDLADKMIKMINLSEEERIEMGRRGREKVIKEFDERIVIEEYLRAIERLVGKQ